MVYRAKHTIKTHLTALLLVTVCSLACLSHASAQTPETTQAKTQETATLNLNNADIRVLINTVSEATGKNFIIDPRVKSKVTVVSSKPMGKDEIYEVFLSILAVHGFAAVPDNNVIKIVPDANAKQDAVPTVPSPDYGENSDQLVTQVVVLSNVSANQLVPILRPLVPQQGHLAAYAPSNVLIITDRAKNITRLIDVIRRIDRPDSAEIEIIKLQYASANEVVRIINVLVQQAVADGSNPDKPTLTADPRTNSVLISGEKSSRLRIRGIIAQLDTPSESGGNTQVIFLKYAEATEMVGILQGISTKAAEQQQQQQQGGQQNRVDIQADESNNALVITGEPSIVRELERIIRQLDIQRAQVLIEAIIAEVSTDLASELGAQILVNGANNGDGEGPVGGSIFSDALDLTALAAGTPQLGDGLTVGIGDTSGGTAFALILRALKGDAATNILSTPTLVTMDNVEAEIVFGQNVPFVTGSFTSAGGGGTGANPFQTIERQDVGLTLKVKPQINEGNAIKMEIEQEVSSINTSASASDVVTNKRSIRTQVMVEDGQTIVLGGLIEDRFSDTQRRVPVLGSIPILGRLFSYTRTTKVKSNLMVFIRPVILDTIGAANYFTNEKYSLLKARQIDAKIGKRGLIRKGVTELPEIEVLFTPLPAGKTKPMGNSAPPTNSRSTPATIEKEGL